MGLLIQARSSGSAINSTVHTELVFPLKDSDCVSRCTHPGTKNVSAKLQMPQRVSRNPQGRRTPLQEQIPKLSTPWHGILPVTGNDCQPSIAEYMQGSHISKAST